MDIGINQGIILIIFFLLLGSACKVNRNIENHVYFNHVQRGYKINFLEECIHQIDPDSAWKQFKYSVELDNEGIRQQDTLRSIVSDRIKKDMLEVIEEDKYLMDFTPTPTCIYAYCLDMYKSSAIDHLARDFKKRLKKKHNSDNKNWLSRKNILKRTRDHK